MVNTIIGVVLFLFKSFVMLIGIDMFWEIIVVIISREVYAEVNIVARNRTFMMKKFMLGRNVKDSRIISLE